MEERPLRVFLIEDDEDDYILIKEMLSKIPSPGIEIEWFNDYDGGLEALCSRPLDACLMDYRLGERSGLELLREAIQKGCEAPIVLLTGQGDHEVDVEAMKAGAYDYLVKGQISPDLLERSIRFAMERNRTEKELRRARADLEVRVRERTADLSRANEELRRENTERRRVEEALRESEERYRVLVEGAQDIIFRLSSDGSVLSLNPAFQFLTGEPVDRWLGERFFPLVHPDDQTLLQERLLKILEGEFLPPVEVRVLTRAIGYRILELKARPQIHDGRVIGAIGTARDITDRKTVEEDLRSSRDEMEKRVMKRTSELSRSHETLRLEESRLEALLELNRISGSSLQEIADYVLDQQIRLTGSKVGFLGLMNHEETLFTVSSFSLGLKEQCGAKGSTHSFPPG
jgi:PAS domain S-box-containing protein